MLKTDYKNKYQREHYDNVHAALPSGSLAMIKRKADECRLSMTEYLYRLILNDDDGTGHSRLAAVSAFTDADRRLLESWQVPKKYFEMIESIGKTDTGYMIRLKDGYTNDLSGGRVLQCATAHEVRRMIGKTHKVYDGADHVDGLTSETVAQLKRWQLPKKYYSMVESIGKDSCWVLTLKEGYTNDAAGGRVIRFQRANDIRSLMKQTHAIENGPKNAK